VKDVALPAARAVRPGGHRRAGDGDRQTGGEHFLFVLSSRIARETLSGSHARFLARVLLS